MTITVPPSEPLDRAAAIALGMAATGRPADSAVPPGFPVGVPLELAEYEDWSGYIEIPQLWIATVRSPDDVVAVCNWANGAGYGVRALGHSHNWSPLVLPPGTPPTAKVILVDTSALPGNPSFQFVDGVPTATFGAGTTIDQATQFLESLDNAGASPAPGYTFQNMTAPGSLTLGGVLAIGGHGTGVPWSTPEPDLKGCLSNLVMSFKAVVTDPASPTPDVYAIREFSRTDADAPAFLVHLGRAFLTEVTLRVIPNYYLQVKNWYPDADVLFADPGENASLPAQSLSSLLDRYGRLEVIWFPFTSKPWVKTWELQPSELQPQVPGPYNYPWANSISKFGSEMIKVGLFAFPDSTYWFGIGELAAAQSFAPASQTLNGTARDLLLYVQDTTLRVTACGYALQVPRAGVQDAASAFYRKYSELLAGYAADGKYPVNGPVELRFTTVDRQADLGPAGAAPPAIAATRSVDPSSDLDTVFWVDVLTLPGTKDSGSFFAELEGWMWATWGAQRPNPLRPEWSKGWAYTPDGGPWTNLDLIQNAIPAAYDQSGDASQTFEWVREVLARYDRGNLFTSSFLNTLMPAKA